MNVRKTRADAGEAEIDADGKVRRRNDFCVAGD